MRILFAWELGAGMGHLSPHRHLLERLVDLGHEVQVVARDVARAARAYRGMNLPIWQTPLTLGKPEPVYNPTATFAQVLHNGGFFDQRGLVARTSAWDLLLDTVKPDLILIDYAPTLLLALRGRSIPTVVLATGFFVPPRVHPLPVYWTMQGRLPAHIPTSDEAVHQTINDTLRTRGQEPLERVADLFHEGAAALLKTYPSLDHYPQREGGNYVGSPPSPHGGVPPRWPEVSGPKVFAYLKNCPGIDKVLQGLAELNVAVLISADGIAESVLRRNQAANLRFENDPVDLWQATREAALCVNNANHGTTAHFLLQGIPILAVPLHLEQQIIAASVNKMGAGLVVNPQTGSGVREAAEKLLAESSFGARAQEFSRDNAALNMERHLELVMERLEALAPI